MTRRGDRLEARSAGTSIFIKGQDRGALAEESSRSSGGTVPESMAPGVQWASSREVTSPIRRSIRPKRATRLVDASVDPTEARKHGRNPSKTSRHVNARMSGGG